MSASLLFSVEGNRTTVEVVSFLWCRSEDESQILADISEHFREGHVVELDLDSIVILNSRGAAVLLNLRRIAERSSARFLIANIQEVHREVLRRLRIVSFFEFSQPDQNVEVEVAAT